MLIDTHCHIPHEKYDQKPDEIIKDSFANGISKLITVGTSVKDSIDTLEISRQYENIYSTIGVYPHEDKNLSLDEIYQQLEDIYKLNKSKIVGIGECGVDISNWENGRKIEDQIELFKLQIGFAHEHGLPIVLHNRSADMYVKNIFSKYTGLGLTGVAHCFVGNWEFAKYLLDFGFYISFSGIITYPNVSKELIDVVKNIPLEKIVIETDAPYLAPQKHRGQTNFPKYVKIVAETVAQIRNSSYDDVARATYKNACDLFDLT